VRAGKEEVLEAVRAAGDLNFYEKLMEKVVEEEYTGC
jgi:hypothetical protein